MSPATVEWDNFGGAVAVSPNRVSVLDPLDSDSERTVHRYNLPEMDGRETIFSSTAPSADLSRSLATSPTEVWIGDPDFDTVRRVSTADAPPDIVGPSAVAFGSAVAMHLNLAVVGSPLHDTTQINVGRAHFYWFDEGESVWEEFGGDLPTVDPSTHAGLALGHAVALGGGNPGDTSGAIAALGMPGFPAGGAVRIYSLDTSDHTASYSADIAARNGAVEEGHAVAVLRRGGSNSPFVVLTGDPSYDSGRGRVMAHEFTGAGFSSTNREILPEEVAAGAEFGHSIAAFSGRDGTFVVIGAPGLGYHGAAFTFEWSWEE